MSFIGDAFGLAAPEAAIVSKLVEVAAVLAIAGGVIIGFAHHERGIELAKLHKSSDKLLKQANDKIDKETAQHAADNETNQETLDAALKANAAVGAALDQRVHDFDAYRRSHPDVPRPAGGPAAASQGECGALSCGDLALQLAESGNDLAGSNGELAATLQACQRDRDSLTGLPR